MMDCMAYFYERREEMSKEEQKEKQKNKFWRKYGSQIITGAISALMASAIIATISYFFNQKLLTEKLEIQTQFIKEQLDDSTTEIKEARDDINELEINIGKVISDVAAVDGRVTRLENTSDELTVKLVTGKTIAFVGAGEDKIIEQLVWKEDEIVAVDTITNKEYSAKDLENKRCVISYEENGQNVYFYGMYNEDMHWDGECLINVYSGGNLVMITQAVYDDGKLLSYGQVFSYSTTGGSCVWTIATRTVGENDNSGESWNYIKGGEVKEEFTADTIEESDMMFVEDFKKEYAGKLEAYYCGNTKDGSYNDESGNAYLIKFFEDGTVRTLYVGSFKDGFFEDKTGNAWYITKDTDTDYMYYKGNFSKNHADHDKKSIFQNNLTTDDIRNFISGYKFNQELKWNIDGNAEKIM